MQGKTVIVCMIYLIYFIFMILFNSNEEKSISNMVMKSLTTSCRGSTSDVDQCTASTSQGNSIGTPDSWALWYELIIGGVFFCNYINCFRWKDSENLNENMVKQKWYDAVQTLNKDDFLNLTREVTLIINLNFLFSHLLHEISVF